MIIFMRGWPGSGKTRLANQLAKRFRANHRDVEIFSTDDYWLKQGNSYPLRNHIKPARSVPTTYEFTPTFLEEAHAWNLNRVTSWLLTSGNQDICIVDNTNIVLPHMAKYMDIIHKNDLHHDIYQSVPDSVDEILILWQDGKHKAALDKIYKHWKRNIHEVPLHAIVRMMEIFEPSSLQSIR